MPVNKTLEKLYNEDLADRQKSLKDAIPGKELNRRDKERLIKLRKLLPEIDTSEIWNCHYVAYLFQHGKTSEDYKKAHEYARRAVNLGSSATKWLYAATFDRWLVSQGKPQKFGTQFRLNKKGTWELILPIDKNTTDKERAKFGVPPIEDALEVFLEKIA